MSSETKEVKLKFRKQIKDLEKQLAATQQMMVQLANALRDTNRAVIQLDQAIGVITKQPFIWPTIQPYRIWRLYIRPAFFGKVRRAKVEAVVGLEVRGLEQCLLTENTGGNNHANKLPGYI